MNGKVDTIMHTRRTSCKSCGTVRKEETDMVPLSACNVAEKKSEDTQEKLFVTVCQWIFVVYIIR